MSAVEFDRIYVLASAGESVPSQIAALITSSPGSPFAVLDQLAIDVATRYQSGALPYSEADLIMNQVFACMDIPANLEPISTSIAFQIYQAFDEGEYQHPDDGPEEDPELKYTRPLIAEILKRHGTSA